MSEAATAAPEFSRLIAFEDIADVALIKDLTATQDERAALATRFGLVSIDRLEGRVELDWIKLNRVLSVSVHVSATVAQTCVVSLEPLKAEIDERVQLFFARDLEQAAEFVDPEDTELIEGENLDIGEIVAEEMSLALDPYPRKTDLDESALNLGPGATLLADNGAESVPKRENPFEALAALKPKLEK